MASDEWDSKLPATTEDVIALLRRRIEVHAWWRSAILGGNAKAVESQNHGTGTAESHATYVAQYEAAISALDSHEATIAALRAERDELSAAWHGVVEANDVHPGVSVYESVLFCIEDAKNIGAVRRRAEAAEAKRDKLRAEADREHDRFLIEKGMVHVYKTDVARWRSHAEVAEAQAQAMREVVKAARIVEALFAEPALPLAKQCALRELRIALSALPSPPEAAPIPMVLHCPSCGLQHIDAATDDWPNPPHRSHLCHGCGCIWRPADVPTTGVASVSTRGKADSWPSPPDDEEITRRVVARSDHWRQPGEKP